MEVSVEKKWAEGLTQEEFEREFMRRHPMTDVIPNGEKWVHREELKYKGIPPIQAEDYVDNDNPGAIEEQAKFEEKKPKIYSCRGCGKEITLKAGWMRHETFCKAAQNIKLIYNNI